MKLVLVHPSLSTRGGAERVVLKIAQHFNSKIYCTAYDPKATFSEFKDCEVEVIKTKPWSSLPYPAKRIKEAVVAGAAFYSLKLHDYDVIGAVGTPSEWVRNNNKPLVWYCLTPNREAFDPSIQKEREKERNFAQSTIYSSFALPYKIIERRIVPKIEYIFAISKTIQTRLKNYLNTGSEVLYPGIEYERFYCSNYKHYFLYPSRIAPEKRFEFAIEAFKKFRAKIGDKKWKLIIAGSLIKERPDHVNYYKKIKKMIMGYGEIKLDLPTKDISKLYSNCYSVLYSPINEDFGLVPLEALSSYKPCIAINEGGPKEILIDGETGFLVNSVEEMARRMGYLVKNQTFVEEMGKNGRKYVEKNFSWDQFLERFETVCRSLRKVSK
jgi:glycosyltransferase involved in cell wall biosynthesis